jgi:hypothetical protein
MRGCIITQETNMLGDAYQKVTVHGILMAAVLTLHKCDQHNSTGRWGQGQH